MFFFENYTVFLCKIHKKTIHHHKNSVLLKESPCWDCWRDVNINKRKKENELIHAKELFHQEYMSLWAPNSLGGISFTKIENNELTVSIEYSPEVFNQLPDKYLGITINKSIVGQHE